MATAGTLDSREVPPPAAPPAPVLQHREVWVARVGLRLLRVLASLLALAVFLGGLAIVHQADLADAVALVTRGLRSAVLTPAAT